MAMRPYGATVIQPITRVVTDARTKRETMMANVDRCCEIIDMLFFDARYGSRLVLFPEFFLTSIPESRTMEDYMMYAVELPGEYTESFSQRAQKYNIYISGNTFERDPHWPDRLFNTSWIIGPSGDMILKYRKTNGFQLLLSTNHNPGDMYDEYVETYGEDALFPVVDTELGRLACLTCYDVNFPEVARCLAFKGAEVILMPTGDGYTFAQVHRLFRRARALENTVYLLSASHGKFIGGLRPADQQRGYSDIIDFHGQVVAEIDGPGEASVTGSIDIHALRCARERFDYYNYLPGVRASLYARQYAKAGEMLWPMNAWSHKAIGSNRESRAMKESIREGLYEKGVWRRPD